MDRANPRPDMPDLTAHTARHASPADLPPPMQGLVPGLAASAPSFVIGRNAQGQWLAVETHGLGGGIFRTCGHALSYAAFETGHRPQAVHLSDEVLALDL